MFTCLEWSISPCCFIWALNKPTSDNIVKFVSLTKEAITDNFYMNDYLD